jgi:hypothetical protein
LLPKYRRTESESDQSDVLDNIERAAVISGPRCRRRAEKMRRAFDGVHRPQEPSDPTMTSPGGSQFVDRSVEREELERVTSEFDHWLRVRADPLVSWLDPRTWKIWPRNRS